jgi:hypothetical protein
MSSRTPRLEEVAAEAGVSTITASRALRQPEKVAPETRARIEAAVARLGYVPNLLAGALASARSRTVAILVPTLASSMFAETIDGLTEALEARGYAILVAQSGYDPMRERRALSALLGRRPEALVMVGSPSDAASATLLERRRRGWHARGGDLGEAAARGGCAGRLRQCGSGADGGGAFCAGRPAAPALRGRRGPAGARAAFRLRGGSEGGGAGEARAQHPAGAGLDGGRGPARRGAGGDAGCGFRRDRRACGGASRRAPAPRRPGAGGGGGGRPSATCRSRGTAGRHCPPCGWTEPPSAAARLP